MMSFGLKLRVHRGHTTSTIGETKTKAFVKDWLVRDGLEKLVDVLKGMFSQF